MSEPRRRSVRKSLSNRFRKRNRARRLTPEQLERRLLLAAVTSVDPLANSYDAPLSTDVAATFDEAITAGATAQNFVVQSEFTPGITTVGATGMTVTADRTPDFFPGERVQVTATAGIQGATANTPRVWQFRAGATAGSGQFVDSGQVIGPNDTGRSDRVAFGDVDGDGDLDSFAGTRLWLNDGTGVFTESGQSLTIGGEELLFGDVDGDSDLDLIGQSDVFVNNGSGVFSPGADLNGDRGSYNTAGTAGDLDGDGDLDIMQGNTYGPNRVFINNGAGGFTDSGQSLTTLGGTDSIKLADFDGDGDLDALEAVNGGANRIWINDGNAVFASVGAVGGFDGTKDIDTGDVDGDGDVDLLIVNNDEGADQSVRIWLNGGTGQFTNSNQTISPGSGSVVNWAGEFADVDADGDLDVVVADRITRTVVYLNDGAGTFSDSGQAITFGTPNVDRRIFGIALADVDGDGDLDLWEANQSSGGNRIWLNQNLQPTVSLSVDPEVIAEAAGVATVTATLSAAHTEVVTIDLAFLGSATPTDDYTASANQITIAAGATSGSVTITAVQDAVDEPDEIVQVEIDTVTNATEAGSQQVIVTIVDDDEPIPVPDVTLSVDNGAIPEAGGVATFTANLSVPTTVPVTIDLGISGTAAASDFTSSGTQIVVAPGATSGSITITAVQDADDEPDETVVVDIVSVTGGTEAGTQQQTTTITDDDEPPVPDVTLSVDNNSIPEAAGVAVFTVTLSQVTTVPVTVDLGLSGTASAGDFTLTATQVVIAPGATTGTATVTAVQDEVNEPDETVVVDIAAVAGGNEAGEQQQTVTIVDDDVPPSFVVTELEATDSGFIAHFNNPLDGGDLNLYDTQNAGLGASDVVVTGANSGPVAGSLIVGETSVEFIKTGDPLAADTYTVTLRSATDGFEDTAAMLLDGNGDGTGGDDYVNTWTVAAAPEGARTVGIPDFVRGPGQDVNLPADTTAGIPISISDGTNVRAADIRITYDPALLSITGAAAPAGGTVVVNTATPGLAILVYFSTTALPAGPSDFISLQATVPTENASAIYRGQQVLDVHDVLIGDGNDNEFPVVVDDGFHLATYFADVSGNGRINASDAAQVARFAALIDSGFAASLNSDPIVVGDISGNGRINAADASRVAQFAALIPVPEIPPVPGGIVIAGVPGTTPTVDVASDAAQPGVADTPGFRVVERFQSGEASALDLEDLDALMADSETLEEVLSAEI